MHKRWANGYPFIHNFMHGIEQVAIVGVGLIGGSLGLALKQKKIGRRIVGIGQPETMRKAQSFGAIDEGVAYEKMQQPLCESDLIFLCTPIEKIFSLLRDIGQIQSRLKRGVLITDVGSTKLQITEQANRHLTGYQFIGGHPMTGSEKSGVSAADPYLFENAIYVLTPTPNTAPETTQVMTDIVQRIGGRTVIMDAERHDFMVAGISHLPQLMAVSLLNTVAKAAGEYPEIWQLAAGGFRDLTRIASSPYGVWQQIISSNSPSLSRFMDAFIEEFQVVQGRLQSAQLKEKFEQAALTRSGISKNSKGFINPLHEILVVVKDEPGVIASISTTLYQAGININDIEVIKVREGEGGTLRLGFQGRKTAEEADQLLKKTGFQTHLRD